MTRRRKISDIDREEIKRMYLEGKTSNEIGKIFKHSPSGICWILETMGIPLRDFGQSRQLRFPGGRRGPDHPNWKGGRIKIGAGKYFAIHRPDHPKANKDGYVMEHRLVAEKILGRFLKDNEFVHHKNKDRGDNRPENLEILTKKQHYHKHYQEHLTARRRRSKEELLRREEALRKENAILRAEIDTLNSRITDLEKNRTT